MKKINLHVYPSTFTHESRILKETKSLTRTGLFDNIIIVARWAEGLKEVEAIDSEREVWRVKLSSRFLPEGLLWKIFQFFEWQIRIFFRFRKKRISIFNAHTLSVIPVGLMFKFFRKSKLIYDPHELETEKELYGLRKCFSKILERIIISHIDLCVVVNESIATWYRNEYGLKNVYVIRNVPYQKDESILKTMPLRKQIGVSEDEILFIYQGNLGENRGIELLLDAFSKVDKKRHIVFMGFGVFLDKILACEKKFPNIHFHPPVGPDEVIQYASNADIGVHLIENTCLNHYFCLPNKIFEYIMSGLPIVTRDFPEISRIVDDAGCGWKVNGDVETIISLIKKITTHDVKKYREQCLIYRKTIGWHKEEETLLKIYQRFNDDSSFPQKNNRK